MLPCCARRFHGLQPLPLSDGRGGRRRLELKMPCSFPTPSTGPAILYDGIRADCPCVPRACAVLGPFLELFISHS